MKTKHSNNKEKKLKNFFVRSRAMSVPHESPRCFHKKCHKVLIDHFLDISEDRANEILESKRCHNCTLAFYCSENCRKKDWPRHKGICLHIKNLTKDILLEETSSDNNADDDEQNGTANAGQSQRKNWKSQTNSKSVGFETDGNGNQEFVPNENFRMARDKRKQIEKFSGYRNRDIRGRQADANRYQYVYYDNFNDGRSSRRFDRRSSSNRRYHSGLFDPNANHEVSDRGDVRDHSRHVIVL